MHIGDFTKNRISKTRLYVWRDKLTHFLTALSFSILLLGCSAQTPTTNTNTKPLPPHHTENGFKNPYVTGDINPGPLAFLKARYFGEQNWPVAPEYHQDHWQPADEKSIQSKTDFAKVTLLGHSTVLLQHKNMNILTDPMFSERAFPVQFAGPKRFTPLALPAEKLPPIDIIVISHNHYDHLDTNTVKILGNKPLWFVPLGLKDWFTEAGISNVVEMDWWDTYKIDDLVITAMPSQHWSRRGLFDMNKSLWASWGFQWPDFSTWFGGDTGYNTFQFKEIGKHFGTLDLAMIPIGAYEPRWFMKNQHANPSDAVKIFKDLNAKEAFGIHWNTFVLTAEPIDEPPKALLKAMKENNLDPERFKAIDIGKTWLSKD
jgi:N-acyl-phosphatidylethanolamine-hydrolysing phospholipase D